MEVSEQDLSIFRRYCWNVVLQKSNAYGCYTELISTSLIKSSQVCVAEEITLTEFERIYQCVENTPWSKSVVLGHFTRFINELVKPIVSGSVIEMCFCNFVMLRNFLYGKHDQDVQLAFATFAVVLLRRKEYTPHFLATTRSSITDFVQWCITTFSSCSPLMVACCYLLSIYYAHLNHDEDDAKLAAVLGQLSSATASHETLCEGMKKFRGLWERLHLTPSIDSSLIVELLETYRTDPDVSRAANKAMACAANCSFVDPSPTILHVVSRACEMADGPLLHELAETLLGPEMQDICITVWSEFAETLFSKCTVWSATTPSGIDPLKSPFVGGTGILRALLSACPEQRCEQQKERFALVRRWLEQHNNDDDIIYNALFIVLYLKSDDDNEKYTQILTDETEHEMLKKVHVETNKEIEQPDNSLSNKGKSNCYTSKMLLFQDKDGTQVEGNNNNNFPRNPSKRKCIDSYDTDEESSEMKAKKQKILL